MKRIFLLLGALLLVIESAFAVRQSSVLEGRVVDESGAPISFATVVLLQREQQVAGLATDAEGRFMLSAPAGSYQLNVQYVGYESVELPVTIPSEKPLGDIVLRSSATEIESVEVMAPQIRREADRFIVDVANSTVAIGKDGSEILETAPGVWVSDDQISINGQSGSKVYINERELKMEGEQLLQYLRTLRAEDISKIEVIPLSGADYDANSSGGIIKITLKRRRDDGLQGSVAYDITGGKYGLFQSPNFNLDYNTGRVNLYASGWFNDRNDLAINDEKTIYLTNNSSLESHAEVEGDATGGGGRVGTVIEVSKEDSVGAEVEYWAQGEENINNSQTLFQQEELLTQQSSYHQKQQIRHFSVALNYIHKLDTLGSHLKVLADYTRRGNENRNNNNSHITLGPLERDSLFYDQSDNRYDILTASLAWEQRLSPTWQLKAGLKYTRNDNQNAASYRYRQGEEWVPSTMQDFDIHYNENIGALYAIVVGRLGRVSLSAGLRGEYTYTAERETDLHQEYFSLFPNAHVAWSMDQEGKHTLVASYARTISRPGFWSLSPNRMQISDYSYSIGNPELDPSFTNSWSLNLVMWYQYSLSLGVYHNTNSIQQVVRQDAMDPDQLFLTWINYPDYNIYYASLSLPIQLTKWWRWNSNLSFMYSGQRIAPEDPLEYHSLGQWYTAMTFQLPKKFMIETSYFGRTKAVQGNMEIDGIHLLNLSVKKRLLKDRLTLSLSAESILNMETRLTAMQPEFTRSFRVKQFWQGRTYKFGISYNFQAGKSFQRRSVESGSSDEKGRL